MEISTYDSAHLPDEKFFRKFQEKQVLCWGNEPFSEFHFCSSCGRIHSINDLGAQEDVKNGILKPYSCLDCGNQTTTFYQGEAFLQEMKDYFSQQVYLIVASEQEEMIGFVLYIRKTIQELIDYELSTRPNSYDHGKLGEIMGKKISKEKPVLCLQQIYIAESLRGKGLGTKLIIGGCHYFGGKNTNDEPLILETHFKSDFYRISRLGGMKNMQSDRYGYVVQLQKSRNNFLRNIGRKSKKGIIIQEQEKF